MLIVCIVFAVALIGGIPIAFSLGLVGFSHLATIGVDKYFAIIAQRLFAATNQYTLLCIPLYILVGELMNSGGLTSKLISFMRQVVGALRGGLAYVSVLCAVVLSAILGAANAVVAILGKSVVPEMEKDGYPAEFSSAVICASGVLGPIIPPSSVAIIYAVLANVSVKTVFAGGIIPGALIAIGYMVLIAYFSKKNNFPKAKEHFELIPTLKAFVEAIPALIVPVVIVGGIVGGYFTPTESGGIAVAVALVAGFLYKTLKLKDLPKIFINAAVTTASLFIIVSLCNILAWTFSIDDVPSKIVSAITGLTGSAFVIKLIIFVLLIAIGCVMDSMSAMIIFVPVLLPLAQSVGFNAIHFGIIFCVMICIGMVTPPVGTTLFVTSNVTGIKLDKLNAAILPFVLVALTVTLLLMFCEPLVMFVPNMIA